MPDVTINYWAVLVAALVNMLVGTAWYSKVLFGNQWASAAGKKIEDMGGAGSGYALAAVAALIQAYVMTHFVQYAQAETFMEGAVAGLWLWLGLVVTTHAVNYIFEGKSLKLFNINQGYFLLVLLINGGLLATWR